ncbi:DDE-domain-containing protein [Zopfia rhizophila CBS 207.26]|uniref:DDE-domain-containing protein n=1 Tax=Zopfia rhizophila CBS 207.26 TaxID=1314779 RepID=A0A6A6EE62_9PEZI|nr:DDE-domain-containing protein [Zopfia rhizophila CBS 207.26]
MDGHSSYCSAKFETFARNNGIIPLWLPSHSSHILQPLDVACFSVVKRLYREGVEQLARSGQHHVTIDDFLQIYAVARPQALSSSNVESAFQATGIVPYNPDEVLDKLGALRITTPDPVLPSSSTISVDNTPKTVKQVERQQIALKRRQHELDRLSTSPTISRMLKLAKTATTALQKVELMATELTKARATSAKIAKKRSIKVKYLTQRESLTIGEAIEASGALQERSEATQSGTGDATQKTSIMVVRHCSACGSPEHNKRTCPALKEAAENVIIIQN